MITGISFGLFAVATLIFTGIMQEPMGYLKLEQPEEYKRIGGPTAFLGLSASLSLYVALGNYNYRVNSPKTRRAFALARLPAVLQFVAVAGVISDLII